MPSTSLRTAVTSEKALSRSKKPEEGSAIPEAVTSLTEYEPTSTSYVANCSTFRSCPWSIEDVLGKFFDRISSFGSEYSRMMFDDGHTHEGPSVEDLGAMLRTSKELAKTARTLLVTAMDGG